MRFVLTNKEIELLNQQNISFDESREYSDDEALNLLEQVRDIENSYAQFTAGKEEKKYFLYGDLADKIQSQIPED